MTRYIGQLSNRIEINKRKLASLEEYKEALLASSENIDEELLADRLEQIDIEFSRLKRIIHANKKAIAHYNAAYNHLIDLRILDNELQLISDPTKRDSLEQEIIEHTNKLQKHLEILPEQLVDELQDAYREYVEKNPITQVSPQVEVSENSQKSVQPLNDFTNSMIYLKLLEIFEAEKNEFNDIKVFNTPTELENFLDKYKKMKMDCYTSLALLNDIGAKGYTENIEPESPITVKEEIIAESEEYIDTNESDDQSPSNLPIVTMLTLVDGLEISKPSAKKLHPANIKAKDLFREELKTGNWLYNIIHLSSRLTHIEEIPFSDFMKEATTLEVNKKRVAELKERINNLSRLDLMNLYNEYYSTPGMTSLPTALKVLISERAEELS